MKDEVVKAVRKVRIDHKQTPLGQLEELFAEESRWKRKLTIATNKMAQVRAVINAMAVGFASQESKGTYESKSKS